MLTHDNRPHPEPVSVMGRACLLFRSVPKKPRGFPLSQIKHSWDVFLLEITV